MVLYMLLILCSFALASSHSPCAGIDACDINCGNSSTQCTNSVIDASKSSTASILCPTLSSCRNLTVICPIGDKSSCEITCTDSLSCDHLTIQSQSTNTTINCVSTDIDRTNICKNVAVFLEDVAQINSSTTINCVASASNRSQVVTVCDGITLTTNTSTTTTTTAAPPTATLATSSSLSFIVKGERIYCDSFNIEALNIDNVSVILEGKGSTLNNSRFLIDNSLDIKLNDSASIYLSSFNGVSMKRGSSVVIEISNGSQSVSNNFSFEDLSLFQLINPDLNELESKLIDANNISISNAAGRVQKVVIENVNGDMTNNFTAMKATSFVLKCRNAQSLCGNLGTINVSHVEDVTILVDKGVNFRSIIEAQHVDGFNVTVLEGGALSGTVLNTTYVEQLDVNISGKTQEKNVIQARYALGFNLYCNNPKSCGGNLQIYTSPSRTTLHCIGTACDMITLNVAKFPDEVTFKMTDCPCADERHNLCISAWVIKCTGNHTASLLEKGTCLGFCCGSIISLLQESFDSKYECPQLANATSYICEQDTDCMISCDDPQQYGNSSAFDCSSNGVIDATHAKSLQLTCNTSDASCAGLNILTPQLQKEKNETNSLKYAQITCFKDGCKDLNIEMMETPRVLLDCVGPDAVCTNITITNNEIHTITDYVPPEITVYCIAGDSYDSVVCDGISIIGASATVSFVSINSTCNNTYIYGYGLTTLEIDGIRTNFINGYIFGSAMEFVAVIQNGSLSNTKIEPLGSIMISNNNGTLNNVNVSVDKHSEDPLDYFFFFCYGGCNETSSTNYFLLNDTKTVEIHVKDDTISGDDYNLHVNNVQNLSFFAHANGAFDDIVINEINEKTNIDPSQIVTLRCLLDGEFNGFNILSANIHHLYVYNYLGLISELVIEPLSKFETVVVNISGELFNSTIDASLVQNLHVRCSNLVENKTINASCSDLTMIIPVSNDAVSSLLCENGGCQNLTFYTVNGMDDISVSLEECPCREAVNNSCIASENEWNIYCESEDGASVFKENLCTGGCCGEIVKDLRIKECHYAPGGKRKKQTNVGGIVAGVCGGILGAVVIVAAVYYYKKKKKMQASQKEELLNVNN